MTQKVRTLIEKFEQEWSKTTNETVTTHSDVPSVDVSEQDQITKSDEAAEEDQVAISDVQVEELCECDPIKKSEDMSVDISEDGSVVENDVVASSDDQVDAIVHEVVEEEQVSESGDMFEKMDVEVEKESEHDCQKSEDDKKTKSDDDVSVHVSEQDCRGEDAEEEQGLDDQFEKIDVEYEQVYDSSDEAQVTELEVVNEDPLSKWEKEFPPLPIRSLKVKKNIVSLVTGQKQVTNPELRPPTRSLQAVAEPFMFLMKVPRLDDSIQEHINLAKVQLQEKTRLRDSFQFQLQEKRANSQIHWLDCESAKDEVNKLRDLEKSKQKQLREESSSDLGSEEKRHLKIIKKEIEILRESIPTASAAATEAKKKYDAEEFKIKQLRAKCKAANDERQAANVHFQSLKKKLSAKNQPFYRYKDDATTANNYARSGNKKALYCLCANQVERVMELWNTNDEFRRDYVKSNARSTIRRLGTLDGRSLGPGEKSPVLPSYPHQKGDVAMEIRKTEIPYDEKQKMPTRSALKKLSEAELTKKAEEMVRKEEAEEKFKEQRHLEEQVKAEVAREKLKKKQAEKEQREAEEHEKVRQRRLKKKEKKKEKKKAAVASTDVENDIIVASAETSKDVVEVAVPKKTQKLLTKTVSKPPSSLRNRNKKGFRQLMWTGLISIFVYILFRLGDLDLHSKLSVIG